MTSRSDRPSRGFDLDDVDAERPDRPLRVRAAGLLFGLRSPRSLSWSRLIAATSDWHAFTALIVPVNAHPMVGRLPGDTMEYLVRSYRTHHGLCATTSEDRRLAGLVARYGQAIEQDLAGRRLDLLVLWQQRRWRYLLNVIEALPRHSAFVEALSDDDALAEALLNRPAGDERPRTPLSQFSPELEMAVNTYDRLGELIQAVTAAAGGRPPKIAPFPRPRTAADRVRRRRAETKHRSVVARMLPAGPQPAPPMRRAHRAAGDSVPADRQGARPG